MKSFVLKEYQNKYQEKYQRKSNENVFFDFLKDKFDSEEIEGEYFSLLNEADLLESLNYFIDIRKVTARRTANTYLGDLRKLYERLEKDYEITNDIYVNGNFIPAFLDAAKERISFLNDKIDKSIATDEQYEMLVGEIEDFEKKYSYEEAIDGIDKYLYEKNDKSEALRMFRRLCSTCAIQMVLEYGLKNNVVRDIKISDIDLENSTFRRNEFILPLPALLKKNLSHYLKVRTYILTKTNQSQKWLFINFDGNSYHKSPGYAANLFYILGSLYKGSVETESFAQRRLIEMIEKGFNATLIGEITGYKDTTYGQVCKIVNDNKERVQKKLIEFVNEDENRKRRIEKKGYINCPMCGKSVKGISDELVLVKKKNDATLYLACKKCGGYNG